MHHELHASISRQRIDLAALALALPFLAGIACSRPVGTSAPVPGSEQQAASNADAASLPPEPAAKSRPSEPDRLDRRTMALLDEVASTSSAEALAQLLPDDVGVVLVAGGASGAEGAAALRDLHPASPISCDADGCCEASGALDGRVQVCWDGIRPTTIAISGDVFVAQHLGGDRSAAATKAVQHLLDDWSGEIAVTTRSDRNDRPAKSIGKMTKRSFLRWLERSGLLDDGEGEAYLRTDGAFICENGCCLRTGSLDHAHGYVERACFDAEAKLTAIHLLFG